MLRKGSAQACYKNSRLWQIVAKTRIDYIPSPDVLEAETFLGKWNQSSKFMDYENAGLLYNLG